ncbi:annexin-B12-like [Lineus longissimus]|uniref:annexin-B12-like n=1 Tax=Lineus longissimus TaxID=88925 RepID=UPI002B4F2BAB
MTGTVSANPNFDVQEACEQLEKAMKGAGTDEARLSTVLARHSNAQLQEIKSKYQTMYGKILEDELKSELTGKYETLARALIKERQAYEAEIVHKAVSGAGTDERDLIDLICSKNNEEITALKEQYKIHYHKDLVKDVAGDTSGYFKRVLVAMLGGSRDAESEPVSNAKVQEDVENFIKAGVGVGTDESVFNEILCARSHAHLRVFFKAFEAQKGKHIIEEIKGETSGDYEDSLLAVVKTIENKNAYFAERLLKSMKGVGTDDENLIRLVVCRCEIDLADIIDEFNRNYGDGQSFSEWVEGDTSGDYGDLLLAVVSE